MQKKYFLIGILTVASLLAGNYVIAQTNTSTAVPTVAVSSKQPLGIKVTVDDLKTAGFTDAVTVPPVGTRFANASFYFKVKESVADTASWGDSANLVAVLIKPMADANWAYNDGQTQLLDFGGRTQARISNHGYYLVVTGPDKQKVVNLINNLKEKY